MRPSNTNRRLTSPCCRQRLIVLVETLNIWLRSSTVSTRSPAASAGDVGRVGHVLDKQPQIVAGLLARHLQVRIRLRAVVRDAEAEVLVGVGFLRVELAQQPLGAVDLVDLAIRRWPRARRPLEYCWRGEHRRTLAVRAWGRVSRAAPKRGRQWEQGVGSRSRWKRPFEFPRLLLVHNLAKAEEHLAALQKICLLPCEEYTDLQKKIAEYRDKTASDRRTHHTTADRYPGNVHIPSDYVIDRRASSIRGSLILDFPCTPNSQSRTLSENNLHNINKLKIYHEIRGNLQICDKALQLHGQQFAQVPVELTSASGSVPNSARCP